MSGGRPDGAAQANTDALTGGFRRTLVLQIGADIYGDTLRIAAEFNTRYPRALVCDRARCGRPNVLST